MTVLLNEAEGKNIKLSKDVSTLSAQVQDAQVSVKQKNSAQLVVRCLTEAEVFTSDPSAACSLGAPG